MGAGAALPAQGGEIRGGVDPAGLAGSWCSWWGQGRKGEEDRRDLWGGRGSQAGARGDGVGLAGQATCGMAREQLLQVYSMTAYSWPSSSISFCKGTCTAYIKSKQESNYEKEATLLTSRGTNNPDSPFQGQVSTRTCVPGDRH